MNRVTTWLFGGYTLLSVCGLLLLKANISAGVAVARGEGGGLRPVALTATGAVCYVAGFGLWLAILSRVPLSRAYPVAVGLTLLFTTVAAVVLLKEKAGIREGLGAVAIFIGVCLLAKD